nr:reverse transcriptase domain-containing protein [Tanacetum cinerariifolium]
LPIDSEPGKVFWGADEELSDEGSPRVIVYGYDGLPMQPAPDYMSGSMYPEYIPLEDEHMFSAKEQPLPHVVSPTAELSWYVVGSDPEEYEDDESEDGPVDYPIDGGDNGDDDDGDSSGDEADDEDEEDEEEEEEHLALANSIVVVPASELVAPPEGTEHVISPPSTDIATTGARIIIQLQASISLPPEAEVERLLAIPTPPPSPLTSLSPPSVGERLARLASTQTLINVVTAALPSPPLPPPLHIPPHVDHKDDIPETEMPPRMRSCLFTLGSRYEIEESSTARPTGGRGINYGFVSTLDVEARRRGIGEVYAYEFQLHAHQTQLQLQGALIQTQHHVHEIRFQMQQTEMTDLRETDHRRQAQMVKILRVMGDMRREIGDIQIMEPVTRQGPNAPPNNTNPNNMTPESVQAMIDQSLLRNSTNRDESHSLHRDNRRNIRSLALDAYAITWEVLKKKMTDKYCPQGKIKKLEIKLWNQKIDNYISGLPDNIFGSVKSSKPKTLDETIKLANDFMDQKLRTNVERQTNNKRRLMIYPETTMAINNNPPRGRMSPRSFGNTNVANTQRDNRAIPKGNGCFKCGAPGHFKRDFLKLKNKDGRNVNAQGWVYALGNAEKKENASRDPNTNVVTSMFLLNNRYASNLFDTGANRSFISTVFSSLIDIVPTPLGNSYDVKLANGKIVKIDTIIQDFTLNFLNHPFNIDLMSVELGSFHIIISMDWLRRYHAVIVCDEKLVQIPFGNETLIFCSDESIDGKESQLTIISCLKAQEYMATGCQIFLAYISAKKEGDKLEGKQLKDVPIIRDFPEVFLEDLPGLPSARPVEFQIDLIPGAAPIARAPYRLAPFKMKEFSKQLQEFSDKGFIRPRSKNFVVYCDASNKGLGAVLMQRGKVTVYASRQLKIHEKNYTSQDLELGSVVFVLKMWRNYLYGTKCTVFTDHKSLQHILDQKEHNMRQRRWLELLSDYDCDIRYHPRKANKALGTELSMSTAYHPETDGQSERTIQTLEDILRTCVAPYEALYGQKCRSLVCWAKVREAQLTGPEMIQETMEKIVLIKQRIQAAQDRQKSYCKLNPRYVRPFKVLSKVRKVSYRMELTQELRRVHHTFHVSNLKKYYADEPLAMPLEGIHVDDKLKLVKEPVKIMEWEIKRLKQSRIPLVKVC